MLTAVRRCRIGCDALGSGDLDLRVIYFVADESTPILALLLYGKNEQVNPSAEQRRAMLTAVERLRATARKKA